MSACAGFSGGSLCGRGGGEKSSSGWSSTGRRRRRTNHISSFALLVSRDSRAKEEAEGGRKKSADVSFIGLSINFFFVSLHHKFVGTLFLKEKRGKVLFAALLLIFFPITFSTSCSILILARLPREEGNCPRCLLILHPQLLPRGRDLRLIPLLLESTQRTFRDSRTNCVAKTGGGKWGGRRAC